MIRHRQKFVAYASLSLLFGISSAGACEVQSGEQRAHLVELYTSEGCNSCPPAEQWMSSIRDKEQLIGLEFHVDYWDSAAWRDPYAKPAWAKRQETKARHASAQVYTPQIWLDGQLWRNWPKGDPPGAERSASDGAVALRMSVDVAESVKVRVQANEPAAVQHKRLYVALTENRLAQQIRGGENKGRKLEHDQVVRDFAGPLNPPEAQVELKLPDGASWDNAAVVAYAQGEDDGVVAQVLRLPLKECKR